MKGVTDNLPAFLAALEAAGCQPRRIGPGVWLAICPACRAAGRFSLMEIRARPDGSARVSEGEGKR